jgi:hypothetical protein
MSPERGQTTLDFAIGISVFLAVLVFVFSFLPGLLAPFTATGDGDPALADRIADRLSQDTLGDPAEPYVLDTDATRDFFDSSDELHEQLNTGEEASINVTLEGNVSAAVGGSGLLCLNGALEQADPDCDPGAVALATGDSPPPNNDATVTARRVVALDGTDVTMEVVVW